MEKDNEVTVTIFFHGLNCGINDLVGLHHYVEVDDLVHQDIKVEQQLKTKVIRRRIITTFNSQSWKNKIKKECVSSSTKATIENNKANPNTMY